MRSICFYFQVHQPFRLRTYSLKLAIIIIISTIIRTVYIAQVADNAFANDRLLWI